LLQRLVVWQQQLLTHWVHSLLPPHHQPSLVLLVLLLLLLRVLQQQQQQQLPLKCQWVVQAGKFQHKQPVGTTTNSSSSRC
jgi:hypothetical protein